MALSGGVKVGVVLMAFGFIGIIMAMVTETLYKNNTIVTSWLNYSKKQTFGYLSNSYYETADMAFNMEDEITANRLYDFSLNSRYGNESGVTEVDGYFGKARQFDDGQTDIVVAPDIDATGSFTFEAWVYMTSTSQYRTIYSAQTNGQFFVTPFHDVTPRLTQWTVSWANTTMPTNQWVHVVSMYKASNGHGYIYQNATPTMDFDYSGYGGIQLDGKIYLGQDQTNSTSYEWAGIIDEVRIYKRALTVAEIQNDMTTSMAQKLTVNTQNTNDVVQLWYNSTTLFKQNTAGIDKSVEFNVYAFSGKITPYQGIVKINDPGFSVDWVDSGVLSLNYGDVYQYANTPLITIANLMLLIIVIFLIIGIVIGVATI